MIKQAIYACAFAAGALWAHAHDAEPWYVVCVAGSVGCATASFHMALFRVAGRAFRRAGLTGLVNAALRSRR